MKNTNLAKIVMPMLLVILVIGGWVDICLGSSIKTVDNTSTKKLPIEFIRSDKKITNCEERKLNNRILLVVSRYCAHCKEAANILSPLVKQDNLEAYFMKLDVINKADMKVLDDFAVDTSYFPLLIIDCNAYVGLQPKEKYNELLALFHSKHKKGGV
jgi:thiol-disulfide isomerase/thioredoxin